MSWRHPDLYWGHGGSRGGGGAVLHRATQGSLRADECLGLRPAGCRPRHCTGLGGQVGSLEFRAPLARRGGVNLSFGHRRASRVMRYARDVTLLPCTPADLRRAERVPFRELPARDLLLFDATVSEFWFEFEPEQDIGRFLQHAHFGASVGGGLVACREDLLGVASQPVREPSVSLVVDLTSELPAPFRFTPDRAAFEAISRGGEFRGRVTLCNCGIPGCFS